LGLTLTTGYAGGDLSVIRGHEPRVGPNNTTSIGRWYRTITPQPNPEDIGVVFGYDPTELNGIVPAALSLFVADGSNGPWSAIATVGNEPANELSGSDQAPAAFITAFDLEATLAVEAAEVTEGMIVYPTVFDHELHITVPEGSDLERFELMEALGKVVVDRSFPATSGTTTVQLPSLAAGPYVLRLNGRASVRLVHP
jgi:hypothetical protein